MPGLLIGDVIRRAARVVPRRLAATLGDAELTFGELDERSNRVGHALRGMGIAHRDRVAWWGDTSLDVMPVFGALAKLGAAFAPVNARLGAAEAAEVVAYARPRMLVVDAAHREMVDGWDVPVVTHDELARAADGASADDVDEPALDERDTHVVFFTSGSTGRSKGVVISHRASALRSYPTPIDDRDAATVCMFPLFHMAGWSMALNAWQTRAPLHLVTTADADALLSTVERRRATRLYLIPAVWSRVLDADLSRHDLSTLTETDTGTSATPPELLAAIRDAFPQTVTRVYYGSTEAGPGTLLPHADVLRKPGSVGLPARGVDVRLADDGEVCIRSELLMDGYFDNADATAAALRDGWYHSGDLGALDDEGYLSIVGRARDVLRTGGETVAPGEVEVALADHPAIAEIAVVGVPDARWGEIVCAVVVLAPGASASAVDVDALRRHCDGRLAPFKHPRRVELVDALPRTPATGQVQRTLILERILSRG
ncbi:MAG TPA: AMP-binding protein [Acidimicrobiia bacterium]|nr:AMP-binding protein [Acidimicrobiia bacterium]